MRPLIVSILRLFPAALMAGFVFSVASAAMNDQDIQIYTTDNTAEKITPSTIEKAFEKRGFVIDGNNDMNKPFSARFGGTHYPVYRLATYHHPDLTAALVKINPLVGLLTPLSMSIWQDKKGQLFISTLSLRGLSRMTAIPMDNPDLVTLSKNISGALQDALPGGRFQTLRYQKIADASKPLSVTFETKFEVGKNATIDEAKDDFEAEFEAEMEPVGFLFPGFIGVNDELHERGVEDFEFFDTYSVCKLDVIYPIHQQHPEVGAFAPCTFFLYKKKGDDMVHMGFPSVQNWITSTDIEDKASLDPLIEAENLFIDIVNGITE